MKNQKAGAVPCVSGACIAAALMLAGCAAKPPPVPFGAVASPVPTDTHPVRVAGNGASAFVRRGAGVYRLQVDSGMGPETAAEADVPVLLPTLVAPDTVTYFELNGPSDRFFLQDLVSGQRQTSTHEAAVQTACDVELKAARRALGPNPPRVLNDEQASRTADGACRTAVLRAVQLTRLDTGQTLLRERRFSEARTALLTYATTYPDDGAVAAALFGAGVADYVTGDFRSAAALFRQSAQLSSGAPTPTRAAEALLAAADSALEAGERTQSFTDLAGIVARYPSTGAAAIAGRRIAYEKKMATVTDKPDEIEQARFAVEPRTVYPEASRRAGEQGVVVVNIVVQASGEPGQVSLETSSGLPRLDQAALEAARGAYFFPARAMDGQKKTVLMRMPIRFEAGS